jgi:hypothetical protein
MGFFSAVKEIYLRVIGAIDSVVAPIYRITFVGAIFLVPVYYFVAPFVIRIYNWIDTQVADFGPRLVVESAQTRMALAVILCLIGIVIALMRRAIATQKKRLLVLDAMGKCSVKHLSYYDALFTAYTDESLAPDAKLTLISQISREHSVFLCSRLAEIFGLVTSHPCHASVKTFDRDSGEVATRTRDALIHNSDRVLADQHAARYNYSENTAFSVILGDDACDLFLSNWLKTLAFRGGYVNGNKDWKKHYAAAIVAPISSNRHPGELTVGTVIGFICVDNKRGGFSEIYCRAVLVMFVAFFNDMMVKLGEMELP